MKEGNDYTNADLSQMIAYLCIKYTAYNNNREYGPGVPNMQK